MRYPSTDPLFALFANHLGIPIDALEGWMYVGVGKNLKDLDSLTFHDRPRGRGGPVALLPPLTSLPPGIGQFRSLRSMRIDGSLTTLPAEIGQLEALEELDVGNHSNLPGNHLTTLPAEIGQLRRLRKLDLTGNRLCQLPREMGQLTHLQDLCLDRNQLTRLPAEIGHLALLRQLSVRFNELAELPVQIGGLQSLQYLHLDQNRLTTLPEELGRLSSLLQFTFSANPHLQIPPNVARLFALSPPTQSAGGVRPLTPFRVLEDRVLILYFTFYLQGVSHFSFVKTPPDWVEAWEGSLKVSGQLNGQYASVRLEAWTGEPSAPAELWDETCEILIDWTPGTVFLEGCTVPGSGYAFPFGSDPLAEDYHLRISRRLLAQERYLFQFWPVPFLRDESSPSLLLSDHERAILVALAQGKREFTIAKELQMSLDETNEQIASLFHKLEVQGRAAAIGRALKHGWISLEE
jgi:DNA-binding CsgD family transcriptional regulator